MSVSVVTALAWRCFTHLDLVGVPCVHTQRLDFGDVSTQLSMQRRTSHAEEDAQVPAGPSWVVGAAVGTFVIARNS